MPLPYPCAWFGFDNVVTQQRTEGTKQHIEMLIFAVVAVQRRRNVRGGGW